MSVDASWPKRLDADLTTEFGKKIEANTAWNVLANDYGGYVTNFETDDPTLRERIEIFIEAWMKGAGL